MHKSVDISSVPDSYTLLFIVKSYLNVFMLMSDIYLYIYSARRAGLSIF